MLFFLASRALGLLRDVVISHHFGTSRALDAYFAAFSIPDLIFNVIAGGAVGSAFIPTFSAALASGDRERAWRLASAVLNVAFLVLTGIAAVLAVLAPEVTAATVARGFAAPDQALTATLMRWMLLTPILFGLSGILMGILNSHQHFVLPALAPVIYNAAIIAGALFLAPTLGVYGLVSGVVAGAVLHLAIQVPWLCRHRMQYSPSLGFDNPDVREVGRLMLPRTLGLAAVQVNILVSTILASTLPAGRIAALAYAWRVMLLPEGIIALSLATAAFPTFSELMARRQHDELRHTFSNVFRMTLYLTVPAAVGLFVLGEPLVALLFQRGEFDAQSTAETAWALQFYAVGLIAHSGLEIITRVYYAMQDTRTPVVVGVGAMVLNVGLSLVLLGPFAHGGLAFANSLATIGEVLVLFNLLRRRPGWDAVKLGSSLWRIGAASAVMGLVVALVAGGLAHSAPLAALVGVVVGALVYLIVTCALGSEEVKLVLQRFRSRR